MLDFNEIVGLPVFNQFARPIVVTPLVSQPGVQPYNARGTYFTQPLDVMTEGNVIFSDQRTMLAVRISEFPVPMDSGDRVFIPAHMSMPSPGMFEVQGNEQIGGTGKAHLTLKRVTTPLP